LTLNKVEAAESLVVESERPVDLGIGDMARASGLSVSALRFYDRAGVLPPAYVDPGTGYRWYTTDQVRAARIVAGLRRVAMPLAQIVRVLADPAGAAAELDDHLRRIEGGLADARRELSRVRMLIEPEETTVTTFTVEAPDLAAAIDAVRFAASSDPELPMLAGVLLDIDDGQLHLVATDRYRLAGASAPARGEGRAATAIAPLSFVDEVRPLLTGGAAAAVTIDGDTLRVRVGESEVTGVALGYDFPDYRRLLPGRGRRTFVVDAARLRADLKAAGAVAVLTAGAGDEIAVESGEPAPGATRMGVNPEFLLQALDAAGQPQLVLELDGPVTPLVLRPAGNGIGLSILMPVRLP
jgi:DNA polymerase III subunit beta